MKKRAQSTIEYAFFISMIAAALISMFVYIQRAMMGRLRKNTEEFSAGLFYAPGQTISHIRVDSETQEESGSWRVELEDNEENIQRSEASSRNKQSIKRYENISPL